MLKVGVPVSPTQTPALLWPGALPPPGPLIKQQTTCTCYVPPFAIATVALFSDGLAAANISNDLQHVKTRMASAFAVAIEARPERE